MRSDTPMCRLWWMMKPRLKRDHGRWMAEVRTALCTYQSVASTPYAAWYLHRWGFDEYRTSAS
jgi:hypothetical protein